MKGVAIFYEPGASAAIQLPLRRTLVRLVGYSARRTTASQRNGRGTEICLVVHLSFFLLLPFNLSAQSIDTTYRTTYYEQKVTLFRQLPDTKDEIIFLGNSITDIAEWSEIWQNPAVKNRGISGDNTFGVLARLDEVTASKPEKIFIMIGINDIAKGTPDSVIVANHKKIYNRIKAVSPKTKLYVQSILPTNADFTEFKRHQNKDANIRFVNEALKKICAEQGLIYVDLYSRFLGADGKMDKRYTNDGLHINGNGYMLWKEILSPLIPQGGRSQAQTPTIDVSKKATKKHGTKSHVKK